jgi:hypothetical protein
VAKNHFWKQFENSCARDFGGAGRFPANQGGALDFETPWAIGQCKTMKVSAKRASYSIADVATWAQELATMARSKDRCGKWPVVCVKVRRGEGVRSETLFCLSARAADEWIGTSGALYATLRVNGPGSVESLTARVEAEMKAEPDVIGIRVTVGRRTFVAMGRTRFLRSYTFKRARG